MTQTSAITVSSAMRPVRALVFVPALEGFPWQASFLGALRAQTCIWGGQSNLPVPLDDETFDHPALWSIAECLDPDAIVVHPSSWGDLEDMFPDQLQAQLDSLAGALSQGGHGTAAIERFLDEVPEQRLTNRWLTDDEQKALVARVAPLHHDMHISSAVSAATGSAGHPFVDVLDLASAWRPETVREVRCPLSLDAELAIAADTGQLSPARRRALESAGVTVVAPEVIDSEWALSSYVHRVSRASAETPPFAIADAGLTWYSQGYDDDTSIRLLTGASPWDFAYFYALRRLTGVAFWVPPSRVDDPLWLSEIAGLPGRLGLGHSARLHTSSISDSAMADALATALERADPDTRVQALPWQKLLPKLPRRHLCTGSVSLPQSLALEPTGDRSGFFVTPVPDVRGGRDPFGMHWMTEVFIDEWTAMTHPSLGPTVLDAPGYSTYNARISSDGIAYLVRAR